MKTNKELKNEYKLLKHKMGVFKIENKINAKIMIGSSLTLDTIWNRHKMQLNYGNHSNDELQNDWKKYGEESFSFEIVDELKEKEDHELDYGKEIKVLEELYIKELQSSGIKVYNK